MALLGTPLLLLIPLLALAVSPRPDALGGIMLALITFIALVINRYSNRYLDGQAAQGHYQRWFLITIASVSVLVLAGDLRIMALAWTASSLALHQLLSFFADRAASQVAAHKKFLLSRLADVAIYSGVFLMGRTLGTYDISALGTAAATLPAIPTAVTAAGFLIVTGVILRSAQLPFHGWLIQVMEAPTPVSALLHAGVVNIGGFVLIRMADLMGLLAGPQTALVIVGATTAVVAGLVMTTRISIKVMLAWSTAAQMGFMLLECGLGAYELALLHLVAHSFYKAHAFLGSGGVVSRHIQKQLASPKPKPSIARWLGAGVASSALAVSAGLLAWQVSGIDARGWVAIAILAVALAPLFASMTTSRGWRQPATMLGAAVGVAVLYVGWHAVAAYIVPVSELAAPDLFRVSWAVGAFALLFVVQAIISAYPTGTLSRRLYPWAFGGFHLDEIFTRATFLVWPPRHVRKQRATINVSAPQTLGRAA